MYLAKEVAPELLDSPPPGVVVSLWRVDTETSREVQETSVGMVAEQERIYLIHFLSDRGFARLVPRRYKLEKLATDELRLRKEAAELRYASTFQWFNGNASDLVRAHFNGFDVMREMGMSTIYQRYRVAVEQLVRQ